MRGGVEDYKAKLNTADYTSIIKKAKTDQRGLQTFVKGSIVGFMQAKLLKESGKAKIKNNPLVEGMFAGIKGD